MDITFYRDNFVQIHDKICKKKLLAGDRQAGAQAPPTFSFSGDSVRDQFDEFLYKSKHICSTAPPQQTNQYSIHHLPPGRKKNIFILMS
jgi:hypothetical protein